MRVPTISLGKQIRRKLNALELAVQRGRQRAARERFGQAGRALEQNVPVARAAPAAAPRSPDPARRSSSRAPARRSCGLALDVTSATPHIVRARRTASSMAAGQIVIVGKGAAFERDEEFARREVASASGWRNTSANVSPSARADHSPDAARTANGRRAGSFGAQDRERVERLLLARRTDQHRLPVASIGAACRERRNRRAAAALSAGPAR